MLTDEKTCPCCGKVCKKEADICLDCNYRFWENENRPSAKSSNSNIKKMQKIKVPSLKVVCIIVFIIASIIAFFIPSDSDYQLHNKDGSLNMDYLEDMIEWDEENSHKDNGY